MIRVPADPGRNIRNVAEGNEMSRLKGMWKYVDEELNKIEDADVIDHCFQGFV